MHTFRFSMWRVGLALAFLVPLVLFSCSAAAEGPMHTYLTWQGNTSTTITVNFQTETEIKEGLVFYDTVSRKSKRRKYAHVAHSSTHQVPGLKDERYIHTVELTGLEPAATYYFIAGDRNGFTPEMKFRTVPAGDEPIRFVIGGDMHIFPNTKKLMSHAASHDPMFCIVGGDIAYVNGDLSGSKRWDRWLWNWEERMITTDGHIIPMVLAIGNHEVDGGYNQLIEKAPFYTHYFAQEKGKTYFARQFGANLFFLLLDSGHIASHDGEQKAWLEAQLAANESVRYKFAAYHVPLYPSHRPYENGGSVAGREHWAPLFDRYGLDTGFGHHDHTHKRTKRIKGGEVDPNGTLYLGDGCFGIIPRNVDKERRWYEEVASSTPHFWLVDVTSDGVAYRAIDKSGEVFDRATTP